jgi:hypothetical protein
MMGSITLADVDVILCPVTDKLEPIDDAADAIRTGTCFFILIVISTPRHEQDSNSLH